VGTTRSAGAAVLGSLTVLLALSACWPVGDRVRDVAHPNPPAALVRAGCPDRADRLPGYDGYGEQRGSGAVPTGFAPLTLRRCTLDAVVGDGSEDGLRYAVREERAAAVPADLLAALLLPDQESTDPHAACPAIGRTPSYLLLVDADGRAVVPRLPTAPCGEPREEVARAIEGAGLRLVTTHTFPA
jgi:hypothetical protein